jgi:hypothetical protein
VTCQLFPGLVEAELEAAALVSQSALENPFADAELRRYRIDRSAAAGEQLQERTVDPVGYAGRFVQFRQPVQVSPDREGDFLS